MANCACATARMIVFDCGSLNTHGICRSIAAQWIRKSKAAAQSITDVSDLGQEQFLRAIWNDAPGNDDINLLHLLGQPETTFSFAIQGGNFDPEVIARELTNSWNRFSLFAVRGGQGGHAMASKLMPGDIEFLDPNYCCWRFANSRLMYDFIAEHVQSHYPDLLSQQAEVYRYRPTTVRAMAV